MRLSLFLPSSLLALLLSPLGHAIQLSQAGVVDWHKNLIGVPVLDAATKLPVFHRVHVETNHTTETKSVILTATAHNVLGAIEPITGDLVWRHVYEQDDRITTFSKFEHTLAVLSGPGGSTLRIFDVLHGILIHEIRLHTPETGILTEPNHLGTAISFLPSASNRPEPIVLTNGHTITRINGQTGEMVWEWSSLDRADLVIHSHLVATPSTIYAIGLTKSFRSYTLHVTSLNASTGEVITNGANIPSSIRSIDDLFTLSLPSSSAQEDEVSPRAIWVEEGTIMSIPLVSDFGSNVKVTSISGLNCTQLLNVGLGDHGQLVAVRNDGTARVLKLSAESGNIKSVWEFQDSASSAKHSDSIYSGGFDSEGNSYIARVYWSHVSQAAAYNVYSPHLAEGKGLLSGFTFPFDTSKHGIIAHAAIDTANPTSNYSVISRILLTTSTGTLQLWQQDKVQWTREESLASINVAAFVELPEDSEIHSASRGGTGFLNRVLRQLKDAKDFHHYALSFLRRFIGSTTFDTATVIAKAPSKHISGTLTRDTFGFRQILVVGTAAGTVYGLDSSTGDIVWTKVLGLGWAAEIGGHVNPVRIYVLKSVKAGGEPEVALVTQRRAQNTLVDTVVFHFNALTGEDVRQGQDIEQEKKEDVLQGTDVISGPLVDCFLLANETSGVNMLVLFDEFLQTYIYPDTPATVASFNTQHRNLHFPLRSNNAGKNLIIGHQIAPSTDFSGKYIGYPTWTLSLPEEEDIRALIPASDRGARVASIGKVLGNRTTLYKYLNPRMFVLLTTSHAAAVGLAESPEHGAESLPGTCGLYVVDGAKGSILYRATLPGGEKGQCDVKVNLVENWLVYTYFDEEWIDQDYLSAGNVALTGDMKGTTKGWRMVSVEFYEGENVDDKTSSSDISSFKNESIALTAYEQSFIFPQAITALTTTATRYGITTRDLIYSTTNGRVASMPRRLLNPRRPHRKPTNQELEEQLIQYDPLLPDDPRRVLSHTYAVSNVHHITTAPSLLESTSLVFAWGLDLFCSRTAPSNTFDVLSESFNKAQLIFTVTGLAVAIMVTRPMVRRKRLRERWYF